MTNNDRIQEIKLRHEAATPGPWEYSAGIINKVGDIETTVARFFGHDENDFENANGNGDFIAHAPADTAYLISEIERIQEENKAMKEALEWYGDYEGNYDPEIIDKLGYLPIDIDGGEKARTALSHLKG